MQENNGTDFQDSQLGRRWSDSMQFEKEPSNGDIWRLLIEIRDRVARIESRLTAVDTAFVKDDLGRPDYDGHRNAHRKAIKDAETVDAYKMDATKKVIGVIVVLLLGFMASGFVHDLAKVASKTEAASK